jgi:hypothetical protein
VLSTNDCCSIIDVDTIFFFFVVIIDFVVIINTTTINTFSIIDYLT